MGYEEIISNLREEIEQLGIKEDESASESSKNMKDLQAKLNLEIAQKHDYFNEVYKLNQTVDSLTEDIKMKEILINAEREKVRAFSLQQEEMSSRLNTESEKLRIEINNLRTNEQNLVEAHQKESTCLRNRITEMESIAKEDKLKHKDDIELLSNELNDKVNCVNLLEAKMRESETQFIETHK